MAITCPPNCIKGTPLWSLYDVRDTNPEYCLYESVVSEYTDIAGFPVLYYRAKSKMDKLYGEDANQDYYEPVETKLYYEPSNEPNIIDGFGIRSDETLEYSLIPKATFTRDVGGRVYGIPVSISDAFGGTGYTPKTMVPTTTNGSGSGLYVDISTSSGSVIKIVINIHNTGSGYAVGDVVTITGGDDNATFVISKVKMSDVGPMPGDVIKTLWNNRNYEIVDVGAEQAIFQAKKLVWEFILRPFRFSEQSLKAEEIYRSKVSWVQIYIHPDGEFADVTYPNGTEVTGIPVDDLDFDIGNLSCGEIYKRNDDGSFDLLDTMIEVEEEYSPHPTYEKTLKPFETKPTKVYGDNEWVEIESNRIDNYGDIDSLMFSSNGTTPIMYGTSSNPTLSQGDVNSFTQFNAIHGEGYQIQFTPSGEYLYIVIPIGFNDLNFTVNGMSVSFVETTSNFVFAGSTHTSVVHRSQYIVNGGVTVSMVPN